MDSKYSGVKKGLSLLMTLVFLAVVFSSLAVWLARGSSGATALYGEVEASLPRFSVSSWMDQEFQSAVENWVSKKYVGRKEMVEAYNSLLYEESGVEFFRLVNYPKMNAEETEMRQVLAATHVTGVEPPFPEYRRPDETTPLKSAYKGTDSILVGNNGRLFENAYVNEALGFAERYRNVDQDRMEQVAGMLAEIHRYLARQDIAMVFVFTPNKAAHYPEAIPDWYISKYSTVPGYERPYDMLKRALADTEVPVVDSTEVFRARGLTNTFTKTSTHWNKLASLEVFREILTQYNAQQGADVPVPEITGVTKRETPTLFWVHEQDIYGVLYSGNEVVAGDAITDESYYYPVLEDMEEGHAAIPKVFVQGGSFANDIILWFHEFQLADELLKAHYNDMLGFPMEYIVSATVGERRGDTWEDFLAGTNLVILEVNEQFVYHIGGSIPGFGKVDFEPFDSAGTFNILESLYAYCVNGGAQ